VKDLALALRLISCYCSSLSVQKCLLLANFTEVSKGRDWPRQEKNTAKKKSGNMHSVDWGGKGFAIY